MSRNKSAVKITPAQRVKEFGASFTVDGMLWCKPCNVVIDHVRRQTITDHITSKRHGERLKRQAEDTAAGLPANKKQTTITGCQERSTAASAAQEKLNMDLVESFMAANIPLEKLDNPRLREFMHTNVKGGGAIPQANTLREVYDKKVFLKRQDALIESLAGKKVAVIVDETTDTVGRYVVNILLQPLLGFVTTAKAVLVNTEFLPAVNNVSIAQLIIRTLTNSNIDFNNVLALVSDNAAYMKKCFIDGLQGLLPNAVHVTCWAHILSLVGEEFRAALKLSDELVAHMKAIFSKAPGRRARFLSHLREKNASKIAMPPVPVITRWNTWFAAALYHANNLQFYLSFVTKEIEDVGSTIQLRKLADLLVGQQAELLQVELEFVSLHCERLMNTLTMLETQSYLSVHVHNKVFDLLAWLRDPGFPYATSDCEAAMSGAAEKLAEYVEGTKQPANAMFRAVRIFDPRQIPLLSKSMNDYVSAIAGLTTAADEWPVYLQLVEKEPPPSDCNIVSFWQAAKDRLPILSALAESYIAMPVASTDVERSFSKYGSILSPLRHQLSQESLRYYCSTFFNQ